ncbi:hypothetical protein [Mycolicibacterium wolinskyi]|uniref:hypothetical protein n=1 Tax=Mycolicibacterium wolinskyi TaxID=59750 RepID=UPI003917A10C
MTERRITGGTIRVEERDGLVRARGIPYGTAARFAVASRPSGQASATRPDQDRPARNGLLG